MTSFSEWLWSTFWGSTRKRWVTGIMMFIIILVGPAIPSLLNGDFQESIAQQKAAEEAKAIAKATSAAMQTATAEADWLVAESAIDQAIVAAGLDQPMQVITVSVKGGYKLLNSQCYCQEIVVEYMTFDGQLHQMVLPCDQKVIQFRVDQPSVLIREVDRQALIAWVVKNQKSVDQSPNWANGPAEVIWLDQSLWRDLTAQRTTCI